ACVRGREGRTARRLLLGRAVPNPFPGGPVMNRMSFVLIALAALACVPAPHGRAAPPDKVQELMRRKLTQSQKVLEGIAVQDFDLIAKHAEGLLIISKQAEWKVLKTPLYEVYSNEFRRNAEELIENRSEEH